MGIRKAINKNPGDKIKVTIEVDLQEKIIEIPQDLNDVLAVHLKGQKAFN